jgi:beta-hydroxylase
MPTIPIQWVILAFYALAVAYIHFRGRVRFGLMRQITDHSTFLAPLNTTLYLSSKVPLKAYLDPGELPQLAPLVENWQTIREECLALTDEGAIKASVGYNDVGFNSFFRRGWKRFYLSWYGRPHPSAVERCPKTLALLSEIPDIKAAMFALLPPGSKLVRHRDPYAGSLRYHLGLSTPNCDRCFIEVDGQRRSWRDGEALIFDETFIHFARNETDTDRLILFCDVRRPLNNPWAKLLDIIARRVMREASTENVPGERIGWINRGFGYLYRVRLAAKAFRKRSKKTYYALKLSLIVMVLYWIVAR